MSDQLNPSTYPQQPMTTKMKESHEDTSKYLAGLADEAADLIHAVDHINSQYELTPARHQCLTELSTQLHRIEQTLLDIAK